jgi:hypothetical protein
MRVYLASFSRVVAFQASPIPLKDSNVLQMTALLRGGTFSTGSSLWSDLSNTVLIGRLLARYLRSPPTITSFLVTQGILWCSESARQKTNTAKKKSF